MISTQISHFAKLSLLIFLILILVGCGSGTREGCEPETAELANPSETEPIVFPTPQDPETIRVSWKEGPHADTFTISEDNTNSACARCHSPKNWTPTAEEIPTNWIENKLEPAQEKAYISEIEWTQVHCDICHASEQEQRDGKSSWLEIAPLGTYIELETTTQLCQKCHLENEQEGHTSLLLKGVHRDFLCTDCHDAHDTSATCSSSACHEPFANECESIETHDKPHSEVTCSACHEAGETEIQWNEELLAWDTYRMRKATNPEEYEPYVSHNIALEVDCDRCHAPGDHPWDP